MKKSFQTHAYLSCCQAQQYSSFHDNSTFSHKIWVLKQIHLFYHLQPCLHRMARKSWACECMVTVGYQTQEVALTDHLDGWWRRSMNEVLGLPTLLDQ